MVQIVLKCFLLSALLGAVASADAPATKPKRKWCNTTVHGFAGDYAYEAFGSFCKEAKATNHCKFCKCRACSFCAGKGTSSAKTTPAPLPAPATATGTGKSAAGAVF